MTARPGVGERAVGSTATGTWPQLDALRRRIDRLRRARRAGDAIALSGALLAALTLAAHTADPIARALPVAYAAALSYVALRAIAVRRTSPLAAAWRGDTALRRPQQLIAAVGSRDSPFTAAIDDTARRALDGAAPAAIASFAPGRRAARAAAAALALALVLVAGGWPAPRVATGVGEAVAALDAAAEALAHDGSDAPAVGPLRDAARRIANGEPRAAEIARDARDRAAEAREHAERSRRALEELAADAQLSPIAGARDAETATAAAIELARALAGAGDRARETVARALDRAAVQLHDDTLARPLHRLAGLAARGEADGEQLARAIRAVADDARREAAATLALAQTSRAARALGVADDPAALGEAAAATTGGGALAARDPPAPTPRRPPPAAASPAHPLAPAPDRIALDDEPAVRAYFDSGASR